MRKSANLSLDPELVAKARALDINLSRAAESGLRQAIAQENSRRWQADNAAALESSNAFVEKNGLPLGRFRQF